MDVAEALRRVLNSDYEDDSFESEEDNDENNEINQSKNNESDISVSEPEESSGNSSSDEVQVNIPDIQTWSHNLKKPNVKEFTNTYGCTFELGPEKKKLDFFLKFFPSTLIEKLVMETNSYAEKTNATARKPDQGWDISAPIVSESYNKYMFGVDIADQKRMQYSSCRKAKKWFKYLFWFCFDLAIVNSLICMKESPNHQMVTKKKKLKNRSQLDFRRNLAQQLIGNFRGTRKRKVPSVVDNCYSAHWPIQFDKPGRCKGCAKESRRHEVSIGCRQCNIKLCIKFDCYYKYHQEQLNYQK
ncbi:hypothetical protein KUTeg_000575 [Tegillarca granosa]|uniref:PiggyBac transposable element-derived protein domain-containing protein n=1 Tax=Tegillarca granosa TaxID=220873 RepID=A0ABQ9FXX7_TEGGR|nr:hypothetical protein KUTeg_000575 [Tegillarca granosa]